MAAESQYSTLDLRQMDREEARQTLPVAEFERWEKLHELQDGAEDTRERWAEEDEQVADLTVRADMDALGTEVDLYGNDVLVHIDPEDSDFAGAAERLDDLIGDESAGDVPKLDDDRVDSAADCLTTMLDSIIVRWNGTEWNDLREDQRSDVLTDAWRKWGIDGLLLAWVDIAAAVRDDREGKMEAVENFRGEKRSRHR